LERLWLGEARLKYPNKWIVAVNVKWEEKCKAIGDIFLITPDADFAYKKAIELKKSGKMGKVAVTGDDDTPHVGGLEVICSQ